MAIKSSLRKSTELTKKNKKIIVNLAINYGSKDELIDAFNKLKKRNKIDINTLEKNLYTKNLPNPDILIRTGGHRRLSNFMLWQLAYTEIHLTNQFWPEFKKTDLINAIFEYQNRERRYGKTSEQLKTSND